MNYDDYVDAPVFDQNGEKVGTIADLYYTTDENKPEWATVKSGLFGMSKHFVPLWDTSEDDDGITLNNVTHEMVKNAPSIDDDEETSDEDDARLRNYYKYNSEALNGHEANPADSEPMPNVALSEEHEQETGETGDDKYMQPDMTGLSAADEYAHTERRVLHRYVVREGSKKWAANVVEERTPVGEAHDSELSDDVEERY